MNLVDVLAFGAHPDDVELGCGGTLLSLKDRGYRFAIVDLTAGEKGSRGDRETRAQEAKAAAELMGATARECLGLPDTAVEVTTGAVRRAAEAIRKYRPRLVISHNATDEHPDHAASAAIVAKACFLAALQNYAADGEPHRVGNVMRYSRHHWVVPSFVVDVTEHVDRKLEAVRCYASQFTRDVAGPKTPISAPDFFDDHRAFMRFHGRSVGALYAEPFAIDGPPAVPDPVAALTIERRDV